MHIQFVLEHQTLGGARTNFTYLMFWVVDGSQRLRLTSPWAEILNDVIELTQ
jgi:hypothetical protein